MPWVRRSHAFHGLIPHFGIAERTAGAPCRIIEYVPPKRASGLAATAWCCSRGIIASGMLRVAAVRRWATREQALPITAVIPECHPP